MLHHVFWEFPRCALWNFKEVRNATNYPSFILVPNTFHSHFYQLSSLLLLLMISNWKKNFIVHFSFTFYVFLQKEDQEGEKKFSGCKDVIAVEYESTVDKEKKSFNSFIINHAPLFLHRSHKNLPQESSVIHTKKIFIHLH